jgi:A/G-specific adenine glycosylase
MPKYQWFTKILLQWDRTANDRDMPWKDIKDPYKIWLSEIILQQTRVEQGRDYYLKLTQKYPTIEQLAAADQQSLYADWQGLGYYNRCRNMHETAQLVSQEYKGKFPRTYQDIRALKGVGDYTAAAIASFAFNLPYAVVDGNVVRVLSRIFGLDHNFYTTEGKSFFQNLAQSVLDKADPAKYNQAMMDFGATVCTPKSPVCSLCPFHSKCMAFKDKAIDKYPVKKSKKPLKIRYFHFVIHRKAKKIRIIKRIGNDIWRNLYILPFIETESTNPPVISAKKAWNEPTDVIEQVLSHQKIIGSFYENIVLPETESKENGLYVSKDELRQYGFPKLIISFFQKNNYL